ncbi:MAG TPA: extracellular solute-binding protein, partial [Ilumatobacteraceae bacterium]|nr:extracellular solute-binding protein [Ilumatobacteraceae bacterium]
PAEACIRSAGYDLSSFLQQPLDAYATQGIQWAMPFNMSVPVLFYLRPDFVEAGLDPDSPPQNFDEFFAAAKQIVDSGAATYSVALD